MVKIAHLLVGSELYSTAHEVLSVNSFRYSNTEGIIGG